METQTATPDDELLAACEQFMTATYGDAVTTEVTRWTDGSWQAQIVHRETNSDGTVVVESAILIFADGRVAHRYIDRQAETRDVIWLT